MSDISTAVTRDITEKSRLDVLKVKVLTCLVSGVPYARLEVERDHRDHGFKCS